MANPAKPRAFLVLPVLTESIIHPESTQSLPSFASATLQLRHSPPAAHARRLGSPHCSRRSGISKRAEGLPSQHCSAGQSLSQVGRLVGLKRCAPRFVVAAVVVSDGRRSAQRCTSASCRRLPPDLVGDALQGCPTCLPGIHAFQLACLHCFCRPLLLLQANLSSHAAGTSTRAAGAAGRAHRGRAHALPDGAEHQHAQRAQASSTGWLCAGCLDCVLSLPLPA